MAIAYQQKDAVLESKRLVFVPLFKSRYYMEDLYQLLSDLEVMKYIGGPQSKEDVKEMVNRSENYFKQFGLDFFCVLKRDTGEFVGHAGLIHVRFDPGEDIGLAFRFHKKFWGQGYATECALILIDWGFKHHQFSKIVAYVHADNENSRRVLEKTGFVYCGLKRYRDKEVPYFEIYNPQID